MKTLSKSLVARAALGLAALAGVFGAVPASARPYYGWGHDRVVVERGYYGPAYYGYGPYWRHEWRPAPVFVPAPAPVVVWHGHYGRW